MTFVFQAKNKTINKMIDYYNKIGNRKKKYSYIIISCEIDGNEIDIYSNNKIRIVGDNPFNELKKWYQAAKEFNERITNIKFNNQKYLDKCKCIVLNCNENCEENKPFIVIGMIIDLKNNKEITEENLVTKINHRLIKIDYQEYLELKNKYQNQTTIKLLSYNRLTKYFKNMDNDYNVIVANAYESDKFIEKNISKIIDLENEMIFMNFRINESKILEISKKLLKYYQTN